MEAKACRECALWEQLDSTKGKHLPVWGIGPMPAQYMVVGEAPGAEEADQGVPLVGKSGRRFDMLLKQALLERSGLYITNLLKHRPPKNRDPKASEIKACAPYLQRQLALVNPSVVIALGRFAAQYFDPTIQLAKDHGIPRQCGPYVLIPMYHPAAALYNPNLWAVQVEDWMRLQERLTAFTLPVVAPTYTLATDSEATQLALTARTVGFDLETTSPKRGKHFAVDEAEIVGYSVSWEEGKAVYVDGKPTYMSAVLESPLYEKVCHNVKFELGRLRAEHIELTNYQCTAIAAYLLQKPSVALKALARQELGRDPITYDIVTQGRDMSEIAPAEIVSYAAADSDNTLMLWHRLKRELKQNDLWGVYTNIEIPAVTVLEEMERRGVLVDETQALRTKERLDEATLEARKQVCAQGLPEEYDVGSSEQVATALEKLGAPIQERTESKGLLRTDEDTLLSLVESGWMPDLCRAILQFRSLRKTASFAHQYLELRGADGRLHPQYIQAAGEVSGGEERDEGGAVTGRVSCIAPNLQQQPKIKGGAWVQELRRCIIPTPGMVLWAADVGQEEPRIGAHVVQERRMLAELASGIPLYGTFGEGLFKRPVDKHLHPQEWDVAKKSLLSFIWGTGGEHSWAPRVVELCADHNMSLTLEEAIAAHRRLEHRFPDIARWRYSVLQELRQNGYVRDYFGRRRVIPDIYSMDRQQAAGGHRKAMNFKIQAPAATVLKLAMRRVRDSFLARRMDSHLLIPIHDELVGECAPQYLDAVADILYHMTDGLFPVALPVEVKAGKNWADMQVIRG
ncbi:MAG TPA: DNA polymerase [Candidatus Tripitaka californicus]|uniref:DNA polymerase n=1 Tax=Candidatus Tripitaka californicus TaxID=3367616 RepID=UPI00402974CE